jgi:hypothetical protein
MLLQSLNSVRKNAAQASRETDQSQKFRGLVTPTTQNIVTSPQKTDHFQSSVPIAPTPVRFGQTLPLKPAWLSTLPYSSKDREAILDYLIEITKFERKHVSCAFRVVDGVKDDLEKVKKASGSERTLHLQKADSRLEERATEIQKNISKYGDLDKAYYRYEMAEIYRNRALIAQLLYQDQQSIDPYIEKCKQNYGQGKLLISEMKRQKPYPDKLPSVEDAYKTCDIRQL